MADEELPASELGTKEYWDKAYSTENDNYDKHGLEGEFWFGEESMDRVIKWHARHKDWVSLSSSVLDLGCGNGHAAISLSAEGFQDVTGVDYCQAAVNLASKIA